jgi:drug resistance MFS transporter, drug:H+ antiporter-2 family
VNKYLEPSALALVTVGLSLAVFMNVLDGSIANVALPTIASNLGVAASQGTWVITAYITANAISVPLTGFLAGRFGQVRLFLISILLFTIASFLCGISPTLPTIITARTLQGVAAGPMVTLSLSILFYVYPPEKRTVAMSIWSMVIVVAPIFGPLLGGYITDNFHWGWIFFINIPIGVLALFLCRRGLKGVETSTSKAPVDRVGLGLMILTAGCLQLMLDQGKELDWFQSPIIITLGVVSLLSFLYLIVWEKDEKYPVLALELLKNRNFSIGLILCFFSFMCYMGSLVLIPQVLRLQYGYTAIIAGLVVAPVGFFSILIAPILGKFGNRIDMRVALAISFLVFAISFYWRAKSFNPAMSVWDAAMPQLFQGIAVALFFTPLNSLIYSEILVQQMPHASSLSNFVRLMSSAVGTSLIMTIWDRRQAIQHTYLSEHYSIWDPNALAWLDQLKTLHLSPQQIHVLTNMEITRQAYINGANEVLYASGFIFLLLIVLIWLAKRF